MAKKEFLAQDIEKTIKDLKLYRSGWANDIREGWTCGMKGAIELSYELYSIAGNIILALENNGNAGDKMAMLMAKARLEQLVTSDNFKYFDELGKSHASNIVTSGTKEHIRIMLESLEVLTA